MQKSPFLFSYSRPVQEAKEVIISFTDGERKKYFTLILALVKWNIAESNTNYIQCYASISMHN